MKRLIYLNDQKLKTTFSYNNNNQGNATITIEIKHPNQILKYNSIEIPINHLEQFIQNYKQNQTIHTFPGLTGL
jgi:hypothetical protein